MSHNTASTSIDAYHRLDAKRQCTRVLNYLRSIAPDSSCISDVAHALNMERSTISGRFADLKESHLIEFVEKRKSKRTGIMSEHWRVPEQESLFLT